MLLRLASSGFQAYQNIEPSKEALKAFLQQAKLTTSILKPGEISQFDSVPSSRRNMIQK